MCPHRKKKTEDFPEFQALWKGPPRTVSLPYKICPLNPRTEEPQKNKYRSEVFLCTVFQGQGH